MPCKDAASLRSLDADDVASCACFGSSLRFRRRKTGQRRALLRGEPEGEPPVSKSASLARALRSVNRHTGARESSKNQEHSCEGSDGNKVRLHIYDVAEGPIKRMNRLLAPRIIPAKFGGCFHVGVEVYGLEFAFGNSDDDLIAGVWTVEPRMNPQHSFRQTLDLGTTDLSRSDFTSLITMCRAEYPGQSYSLLNKNCCHFADDLCSRLGVSRIPKWVNRFARIGAAAEGLLTSKLGKAAKP